MRDVSDRKQEYFDERKYQSSFVYETTISVDKLAEFFPSCLRFSFKFRNGGASVALIRNAWGEYRAFVDHKLDRTLDSSKIKNLFMFTKQD